MGPIRVLVVDDSALVRTVLEKGLSLDPSIEVVGTAPDPYEARDKIVRLRPDVITLDVEMPRMTGLEFLRKLMPQYPLPVIMVSSRTERGRQITLECLAAGAVDFVAKPTTDIASGLNAMLTELRTKIKIASTANVSHWKHMRSQMRPHTCASGLCGGAEGIIAIGASTGGTEAIREVIAKFPVRTPGVVIVQHMPAGFTKMFAERMNQLCQMEVLEASDGDRVIPGRILIAPGGLQMR
ncbi:MAG: response regulator, partial [Proteobacteria bacterium]|nr:response regulator [Pseudomonadota bacterium]MBU1611138.1 response regulator [Pseudomonadota bacterium]